MDVKIRKDLAEIVEKDDVNFEREVRVSDNGLKILIMELYKLSFNYVDTISNKPERRTDTSSGMNHLMVFGQNVLLSSKSQFAIMDAEEQLNKIINPDYLQSRYGRDVENMREIDEELRRVRSELIESLDELKGWPLLPGTRCDRLKDFDFSRPK